MGVLLGEWKINKMERLVSTDFRPLGNASCVVLIGLAGLSYSSIRREPCVDMVLGFAQLLQVP